MRSTNILVPLRHERHHSGRAAPAPGFIRYYWWFPKQLLPVFDKPMIYYPLVDADVCRIRDILVISTPQDHPLFERLAGGWKSISVLRFPMLHRTTRGLAEAFILGASSSAPTGSSHLGRQYFLWARFSGAARPGGQSGHGRYDFRIWVQLRAVWRCRI